jgi:hypothetical protein
MSIPKFINLNNIKRYNKLKELYSKAADAGGGGSTINLSRS